MIDGKNSNLGSIHINETPNALCCSQPRIIEIEGQITCVNCGLIHDRVISEIQQNFPDKKKRVQNEPVFSHNLSRSIFSIGKGYNKNGCYKNEYRLHYVTKFYVDSNKLENTKIKLNTLCNSLDLPVHVKATAIWIENKLRSACKIKSIDMFNMACVYIACIMESHPLFLYEICPDKSQRKSVQKNYINKLKELLAARNIKIISKPKMYVNFLNKMINILAKAYPSITPCIAFKDSKALFDYLLPQLHRFSGKNPHAIFVAIIYITARTHKIALSQKDAARIFKVCEVTLRSRIQDIYGIIKMENLERSIQNINKDKVKKHAASRMRLVTCVMHIVSEYNPLQAYPNP